MWTPETRAASWRYRPTSGVADAGNAERDFPCAAQWLSVAVAARTLPAAPDDLSLVCSLSRRRPLGEPPSAARDARPRTGRPPPSTVNRSRPRKAAVCVALTPRKKSRAASITPWSTRTGEHLCCRCIRSRCRTATAPCLCSNLARLIPL